jgi:hypothetical protein
MAIDSHTTESNTNNGNGDIYANRGNAADENEPVVDYDGPAAPETDETGYRIREEPYGTKRKLRVVLMGAGASSLNFFKKAEEEMENVDITCYEKNRDVGGTWLENRYPGCKFLAVNISGLSQTLIVARCLRYTQRELPIQLEDQTLVPLLLVLTRDLAIP